MRYAVENTINILEDIGLSGEWTTSGEKAVELTKNGMKLTKITLL